ncbi:MAG: M28 family peptidase [Dermatophilaceae bacterium]
MSTRRTVATAVAGAALALGAAAPAHAIILPEPAPPPAVDTPTAREIAAPPDRGAAQDAETEPGRSSDIADALTHLTALQRIADAHGGNRAAGTSGYEASARYVEEQLVTAGYSPWREPFSFTYEEVRSTSLTRTVGQTTTAVAHAPMSQSPGTTTDGVSGALTTPAGAPTGCTAEDWAGVDAGGQIALVARGSCLFAEKSTAAAEAGAVALIVHNTTAGSLIGSLGGHPDDHVPTVGVTQETGRVLAGLPDDAVLTLALDKVVEERQSFSVLAQTESGRTDRVVMLGSHLDGGDMGPGINDNGSGTSALLQTAARLAATGPRQNAVRFAWWGGSDLGNLGSRDYVADLVADAPDERQHIEVYIDVDTVGSPNHAIAVHDAERAGSVLADHLDSIGQPWVAATPPADSDAQAFIENGVPSTGLSTGGSGTKTVEETELFGGTAGIPYDPNHDTVADDIANVDPDVLRTTTAAVAHATETLASRR